MSLSRHEQRLLDHIGSAMSRSDPRLAGKLAIFGRLSVGEPMPGREELHIEVGRIRVLAEVSGAAIMALAARIGATMGRAGGVRAWLPEGNPGAQQAHPLPPRAGPAKSTPPGGHHMRPIRHQHPRPLDSATAASGSPLPPNPHQTSTGSPLPPNPHQTSTGSPLPPDAIPQIGASPPGEEASPASGPAGHEASSQ